MQFLPEAAIGPTPGQIAPKETTLDLPLPEADLLAQPRAKPPRPDFAALVLKGRVEGAAAEAEKPPRAAPSTEDEETAKVADAAADDAEPIPRAQTEAVPAAPTPDEGVKSAADFSSPEGKTQKHAPPAAPGTAPKADTDPRPTPMPEAAALPDQPAPFAPGAAGRAVDHRTLPDQPNHRAQPAAVQAPPARAAKRDIADPPQIPQVPRARNADQPLRSTQSSDISDTAHVQGKTSQPALVAQPHGPIAEQHGRALSGVPKEPTVLAGHTDSAPKDARAVVQAKADTQATRQSGALLRPIPSPSPTSASQRVESAPLEDTRRPSDGQPPADPQNAPLKTADTGDQPAIAQTPATRAQRVSVPGPVARAAPLEGRSSPGDMTLTDRPTARAFVAEAVLANTAPLPNTPHAVPPPAQAPAMPSHPLSRAALPVTDPTSTAPNPAPEARVRDGQSEPPPLHPPGQALAARYGVLPLQNHRVLIPTAPRDAVEGLSPGPLLATEPLTTLIWEPDRPSALPPSPTGPAHRPELGPPMMRQIADMLPAAAHKPVEIALSPQELGRVRLSISTEDRSVTVQIIAERPETIDLLRRHIDQLGASFRQMGFDSIAFSFGKGGEERANADGTPKQTQPGASGLADTERAAPAPDITLSAGPVSGLDLRL